MPRNNNFRHQRYSADLPNSDFAILRPEPPRGNAQVVRERWADVGQSLEKSDVASIYLVHGTFAGTDALGLIREMGRLLPGIGRTMQDLV